MGPRHRVNIPTIRTTGIACYSLLFAVRVGRSEAGNALKKPGRDGDYDAESGNSVCFDRNRNYCSFVRVALAGPLRLHRSIMSI